MIRFVRSASIASGKVGDAIAFAKQIVDYVGKNYSVKLEVMMPVGGNPNRIAWRAEYADLAAMEAMFARSAMDPKYMELVKAGAANFIPGSVNDVIWKTI
jgi:hypothetical protein